MQNKTLLKFLVALFRKDKNEAQHRYSSTGESIHTRGTRSAAQQYQGRRKPAGMWNKRDDSQKHDAPWKNPDPKATEWIISLPWSSGTGSSKLWFKTLATAVSLWEKGRYWGQGLMQRDMKQLFGIMGMSCILIEVRVTKTHQMVHLRFMHFTVFKFYLNKDQSTHIVL